MYLLGFGNIRVNVKIDPIVIEMCGFFPGSSHRVPLSGLMNIRMGYVPSNLFPELSEILIGACDQVLFVGLHFSVIHS